MVEVSDENTGCSISDTITIPGYDNIFASFFTNTTECVSILNGEIQFLDASIINPNQMNNNCYWDFGDGSSSVYFYGENPAHFYTDTGNFNVSLYLENKGLCKDSFSASVCLISENKLFIPNIFTPNGDDHNELFEIYGLNIRTFSMIITNRWGDLVFQTDDISKFWDGKYEGRLVPQGDYLYSIELLGEDRENFVKQGVVNIIY